MTTVKWDELTETQPSNVAGFFSALESGSAEISQRSAIEARAKANRERLEGQDSTRKCYHGFQPYTLRLD